MPSTCSFEIMSVPRYLRFLREAGSFAQHVVEFNVNLSHSRSISDLSRIFSIN